MRIDGSSRTIGGFAELGQCGVEQVQGDVDDGAKAAAFDQDWPVVEDFGGLHYFSIGEEHGYVGVAHLDELQAHQAIVHAFEDGAGELDQVDLDAAAIEAVHEAFHEGGGVVEQGVGAVDEVDTDEADGFLLAGGEGVEHFNVNEDFRRLGAGVVLETDAEPAVPAGGAGRTVSGYGVGEDEECGGFTALGVELLGELRVFAVEHGFEAGAADEDRRGAVEGIADGFIVCRNRFGDGGGGFADVKEPAGHFLSGADLGERAVTRGVQVDL